MKHLHLILLLFVTLIIHSCVEEFELKTETQFESLIVVEATITNEFKFQEILLSRTFNLDSLNPMPESNASIKVVDDAQNEFIFQETNLGKYISTLQFSAQPNTNYKLQITTSDGRTYESSKEQLTQVTPIDDLVAERGFNENGDEGVSILVSSFDPTNNSQFYRYTYEETYKIIAPYYAPFDLITNNDDFPYPVTIFADLGIFDLEEQIEFFVIKQQREEQEQVCFNTVKSNEIIVENTISFIEDRIDRFKVRFINRNNFIMAHRYSILVKQYIQTQQANQFYNTLKELSSSETLFSQTQPGFLVGNVFSATNVNEKVLGFFEISSFASKRVYFNYSDLFPGDILPPFYILDCNDIFFPDIIKTDPITGEILGSPLQDAVKKGHQFFEDNLKDNNELNFFNPYGMTFTACGDCTFLGSNIRPDFWED